MIDAPRTHGRRLWWLILLRGLLILTLGIIAILWPGLTAPVLIYGFGIFALADGFLNVILGALYQGSGWGWAILEGAIGVGIGAVVVIFPPSTPDLVVAVLAVWMLATGAVQLLMSVRLSRVGSRNWTWMTVSGLTAAATGLFLLLNPAVAAAMLGSVFGLVACVIGLVLLYGAYRLFRTHPSRHAVTARAPLTTKQP